MHRLGRNFRQRNPAAAKTLAQKVAAILRKYGTDAHVYLPGIGISIINGLTAGNYLDNAGTTAATVDNPVGLVVDSSGINALQATTANKPILRRGAVNLLTYSEQFDNAVWVKAVGVTIAQNDAIAPNGTLSADRMDAAADLVAVYQNFNTFTVGHVLTQSVHVKKNTGSNFILFRDDNTNCHIRFNMTTGEISWVAGSPISYGAIDKGNGWWRIYFTYIAATAQVRGHVRFEGGTTSSLYIWGAQTNAGYLSDYIATTTAPASSSTGNYWWQFDSTDLLTATFPAGYESATIINALAAGQQTLTAQNIVGSYSIGPSVDTYGRFIFRTGLTASELTTMQTFANRMRV